MPPITRSMARRFWEPIREGDDGYVLPAPVLSALGLVPLRAQITQLMTFCLCCLELALETPGRQSNAIPFLFFCNAIPHQTDCDRCGDDSVICRPSREQRLAQYRSMFEGADASGIDDENEGLAEWEDAKSEFAIAVWRWVHVAIQYADPSIDVWTENLLFFVLEEAPAWLVTPGQ
ncbi:hypothetical protein PENSUB_9260 [Penicillium subrubescens]|uniref:Uncharacterized protein n=1 Tax=Penicillium subrubescens TaxID=1316194 RepID=A0A1Q5TD53_9EURO|nr:hypothetical protein PENSUB_9260 [Penicillium subrubescens]